jgi:lipopolysaccharide export system permease protein
MKAAGISLLQIMRPLIILVLRSVARLLFSRCYLSQSSNQIVDVACFDEAKVARIGYSRRSFYDQIEGYNLFVKRKNRKRYVYDVMIYNFAKGLRMHKSNGLIRESWK